MERENFKSKLGFILVSAGCAIGIGNVWRFPFVTGQNGGGIFVLLYLLFLVIMGIPVLTMELAIGRASKKSAVLAYKKLEKPKSKWHIHGWFCILGCYLLMMYYTPVSGWMLSYFFKFATGTFESGMTAEQVGNVFSNLMSNPVEMIIWMAVMAITGFFVCSKGIQNGIEKVSKVMMILLLALIVILAINSLTLSGAAEGIKFYLVPDLEKVQSIGIGHIITSAMSQAFFTLSIGIGAMLIFGSYMEKDQRLFGEAVNITVLDTVVALMAGFIIIPACFAYGIEPGAGPSLIFITIPNIFAQVAGGRVWGGLFFLFLSFAAFTTLVAVFENIISFDIDLFGWSRKKSTLVSLILIIILSMPCVMGFNVLAGFTPLGEGSTIMDLEDFIVSNNLLPLGSLGYVLFCTKKNGWGWNSFLEEINQGEGWKFPA